MLLASSLEPTGRELIELPKSYSGLKQEVKRLYSIDQGRFHVETKELNLCAGELVQIPEGIWGDIAELLGNVIVVSHGDAHPHPESAPEPRISPIPPTSLSTKSQSPISQTPLYSPPLQTSPRRPPSPEPHPFVHVKPQPPHSVPEPPQQRARSFSKAFSRSAHIRDTFGSHEVPSNPNADNEYLPPYSKPQSHSERGQDEYTPPPSRISAPAPRSQPFGLHQQPKNSAPYRRDTYESHVTKSKTDTDRSLYHRILAGDPKDATRLSATLETARRETAVLKHTTLGITWHGQSLSHKLWSDFEWKLSPRCPCVVRFTLRNPSSKHFHIIFGPPTGYSLWVHSDPDKNEVNFSEMPESTFEPDSVYHIMKLDESIHALGEHSVIFFNDPTSQFRFQTHCVVAAEGTDHDDG